MKIKLYGFSKYLLILMAIVVLSITGCSDESGDKDSKKETQVPDKPGNEVEKPSPTPKPTQKPIDTNVLKLSAYEQHKVGEILNEVGDVSLMANILSGAMAEDLYFNGALVISADENRIVVQCDFSNINSELGVMPEQPDFEEIYIVRILSIDRKTYEIKKEITVEERYVECLDNSFAVVYNGVGEDESYEAIIYDNNLEMINQVNLDFKCDGCCLTRDGKKVYYAQGKRLYVRDIATGEDKAITPNMNLLIKNLSGVVTDEMGKDYLMIWAMAGDYNEYSIIVDGQTGEIVYVDSGENILNIFENGVNVGQSRDAVNTNKWLISVNENKILQYRFEDNDLIATNYILDNKNILFSYSKDKTLFLELFDFETGKLIGMTEFEVPCENVNYEYDGEYMSSVSLMTIPEYFDENTLLLHISTGDMNTMFYEWNIDKGALKESKFTVSDYKIGTNPSAVVKEENELYIPSEISQDLLSMKEEADRLEEKYGIEIYIGQECGNVLGGYRVTPYVTPDGIDSMLDIVDREFEKYPKGFFEQLKLPGAEKIHLFLAGDLYSAGDDNTLDKAGGFKTVEDSRIYLVMDCNDIWGFDSTLHHELSHVIDEKILSDDNYEESSPLSDTSWESLNPYSGMYTLSYDEFGYEEYYEYSYENLMYSGESLANTYFVDTYSMTYPTEDRARIFESIMSEQRYEVDFDAAPHIKLKLNQYAKSIRESFDTTGWEDVPWEIYLNEKPSTQSSSKALSVEGTKLVDSKKKQ